jgi:sigma-B regulation protein RsbU (phosphoserine phosphatase)
MENPTAFGFDFAAASRPVEDLLDGYLEWLVPSAGELAFVLGERTDMSDTALVSNSLILHYFRTAVSQAALTPRRFALELNHLVCNVWECESTATCFYAHYTCSTKVLRFINAGHQPPLLIRRNPDEILPLSQGGPSLGLWNGTRFTEGAVQLKSGDRLAAFTRGVVEAWASEDDLAAEAALVRILHNWRNESANKIAKLMVDYERETGRTQLDRIAVVASLGSPPAMADRDSNAWQLTALAG